MKKLACLVLAAIGALSLMACSVSTDEDVVVKENKTIGTSSVSSRSCEVGDTVVLTAKAVSGNVSFVWYDNEKNNLGAGEVSENGLVSKITFNPDAEGNYEFSCNIVDKTTDKVLCELSFQIDVYQKSISEEYLIELVLAGDTLVKGEEKDIKVSGRYLIGKSIVVRDLTKVCQLKSSDESVVKLVSEGSGMKAVALKAGAADVTAVYGEKTVKAAYNVKEAAVVLSGLILTPSEVSLKAGETVQLSAVASYSDGSTSLVVPLYSTSDATVLTVNENGLVSGVNEGSAVVTAELNGVKASLTVSVSKAPVVLTGISTVVSKNNLYVGDSANVVVIAEYSNGDKKTVEPEAISSSSSNVAITGTTVKAVSEGKAVLTVVYTEAGVTKTATSEEIVIKENSEFGNGGISIDFN